MNVTEMKDQHATLLREAEEALKRNDSAVFDAKMAEADALAEKLRAEDKPAEGPTPEQIRTDAIKAERARVVGIQDAVRIAKLDATVAADMVTAGTSLDQARAEIFNKLAERSEKEAPVSVNASVQMGEDARDKWMRGATNWLLVRSGQAATVAKHEGIDARTIDPGEFRGLTLMDLAKESVQRAGGQVRGLSKMDLAGQAFTRANYQTTSDFSTLLENAMHKVLRSAYGITPDTWSKICGVATVSDFRTHNWYRLGSIASLDTLNEHGEFVNKSIPDAEKATFAATTKGNIIAITREVIINDDLGAVMRLTEMLGRAGKLTIEKAFYTKLAANPTLSDSVALFHASHSNITTGAALSASALDADRVAMASQLEVGGNDYTDLRPAVLLVPVGLGGVAKIINESQYDPDTVANKSQMKPNIAAGLFREVVDTPRLSGTTRYLFADKDIAPVFVVSFLDGQQEPVLETQDGWRTSGVEMKARLDFGVDAVDYRGAIRNAGA